MIKQVIVVRKDLSMRRGKEAAQVAHAAMMWLTKRIQCAAMSKGPHCSAPKFTPEELAWLCGKFTKIVVSVDSLEELAGVVNDARAQMLTVEVCEDAGKTEFYNIPTVTCAAIGPNDSELIDKVTGKLKLR